MVACGGGGVGGRGACFTLSVVVVARRRGRGVWRSVPERSQFVSLRG